MRNGAKLAVMITTAVLAGSGGGMTVALARASPYEGIGAHAVSLSATTSQAMRTIRAADPKLAPVGTPSGKHLCTRSIWV